MTDAKRLLHFVQTKFIEDLDSSKISEIEKLSTKVSIYSIFDSYFSSEEIYFNLIRLLEEEEYTAIFIPKLKKYYLTFTK